MGVVAGVVALIAVLVALAASVAVYPPVFRALRYQSRRIPPERRGPARIGAGITVIVSVSVAALLIAEPWGSHTVLWVALVGGGAVLLLSLAGVFAQAVIDTRRARRRRSPPA